MAYAAAGVVKSGLVAGGPTRAWYYDSAADDLATIVATTYFNSLATSLNNGDFMYVRGSDSLWSRYSQYMVHKIGSAVSLFAVPARRVTLSGSKTQNWDDLATATEQETDVTVTGAVLGDVVTGVSMSVDVVNTTFRGDVTAANTVTVVMRNDTGGNINLASGTLLVLVTKQ